MPVTWIDEYRTGDKSRVSFALHDEIIPPRYYYTDEEVVYWDLDCKNSMYDNSASSQVTPPAVVPDTPSKYNYSFDTVIRFM